MVTGCSRGIGLELVRQLLEKKCDTIEKLFATTRSESKELNALKEKHPEKLFVVSLDINKKESISAALEEVKKHTEYLDLLFNNSGMLAERAVPIEKVSAEAMIDCFTTNVVGTLHMCQTFMPLICKDPKGYIVNVSSYMSSIFHNYGGDTPYRVSKCALNMLTKNFSIECPEKANFVVFHPGESLFFILYLFLFSYEPTITRMAENRHGNCRRMAGESFLLLLLLIILLSNIFLFPTAQPPLTVEEGVKNIVNTLYDLKPENNGQFIDLYGKIVPW